MLRRRQPSRRPGSVYVLFAFLVWAMLGMAALVIDLGLVRATQRQMQTAADMGAIEGVRLTDDPMKRASVRDAVASALDPALGGEIQPNPYPLPSGFGPHQKLKVVARYVPQLVANTEDDMAGDMVHGYYDPTKAPGEANDYTRDDFSGSSTPGASEAFLVRLRRSNETFSGSDTSSAGPVMPSLFARGSLLASEAKANGVTVRATSIAVASPVLSVGPISFIGNSPPTYAIPGATPFGLTLTFWNGLTPGAMNKGMIDPTSGAITINEMSAGNFVTPATRTSAATQVGDAVSFPSAPFTPMATGAPDDIYRYVPIYTTVGTSGQLVVGFGHLQNVTWDSSGNISFQKRQKNDGSGKYQNVVGGWQVPPPATPSSPPTPTGANASASLIEASAGFPAALPYVTPGNTLFITDPLRAPALVR